ncbi:hypothetical protein [Hymenobacter latericus]|uniref:hypothetical protein n=1 Tax=Hymenobacter sp. YIM 151858-1 TaxID=2987688 RepID=UPI002227409E|nr:hypothetical protein [Hymenobacter sp. YIM 151858-1]UYZ57701.1 hypothetical protein OIS50_11535 [Hymenobacter sp. YIM 151858-1]
MPDSPLPAVTEVRYTRKPTPLLLLAVVFMLLCVYNAFRFLAVCVNCGHDLMRNPQLLFIWGFTIAATGYEVWRWYKRSKAPLPALKLSKAGIWSPLTGWLSWQEVQLNVALWHDAVSLHYSQPSTELPFIKWQISELAISGKRLKHLQQQYREAAS